MVLHPASEDPEVASQLRPCKGCEQRHHAVVEAHEHLRCCTQDVNQAIYVREVMYRSYTCIYITIYTYLCVCVIVYV